MSNKKSIDTINTTETDLPSLEQSLAEIDQLIDKMEKNELTIEQSLNNFERGIKLIKHCQKILTEAEQKVQILIHTNDQDQLLPYKQEENKNEGQGENASNA